MNLWNDGHYHCPGCGSMIEDLPTTIHRITNLYTSPPEKSTNAIAN